MAMVVGVGRGPQGPSGMTKRKLTLQRLPLLRPRVLPGRILLLPAVCAALAVASCTIAKPVDHIRHENASLMLSLYRARPLAVANHGRTDLTVHDCIRLALENSLDVQTAIWEEQVRDKQAKSMLVRTLPRINGSYAVGQRDRQSFSRSDVINQEGAFEVLGPGPGTGVTNFSTGRERISRAWQAQVEWSPMDALMARYLADVKFNESAHASYQRVRVAQQLIGTINAAFYRLLALKEALPKAQALESHRKNIVRDLGNLADRQLIESQEYLNAKSLLAEAKNQVAEIQLNIGRQREILAVAMNVSPDSAFCAIGSITPLPNFCLTPTTLEAAALVNRPEAYQADLTHLSSISDHKRLLVKFFPRAEGFIGYFRDENKYLLNKNWIDGGLRVTFDLMEFTATLLERDSAQDKVFKTERERAVISLGILSQVRMKTLEALKTFEKYKKFNDLESQGREALRIARSVEEVKDRRAPQQLVLINREKALCNLLQSENDRILAAGEAHASMADLDASVGTNYPVGQAQVPPIVTAAPSGPLRRPAALFQRALGAIGGVFRR
jgi:outer membrane protein TolC